MKFIYKEMEMGNQQVRKCLLDNVDINHIQQHHRVAINDVRHIVENIERTNKELSKELNITVPVVKRIRNRILTQAAGKIPEGYVKVNDYYLVNRNGEVLNAKRLRPIKVSTNHKGYLQFDMAPMRKTKTMHRLVAETFIPNPDNKPQVNHKDGNKLNNSVDNLEWVTNRENMDHGVKTGLFKTHKAKLRAQGSRNNMAVLKESNVVTIRKLYNCVPREILAEMYNVSIATIMDIVKRRTWKHI